MDGIFDDPGDLGFFDQEEDVLEPEDMVDDNFYEPFPGEEEF